MKKRVSIGALCGLLHLACATTTPSRTAPSDILGVRLNMPRAEVRTVLGQRGKLEREERKRQEVWSIDDARFSGVIVGYDTDWNVRFVTAVAKPDGQPVRYADVLDVPRAELRTAGQTHTYTWPIGKPDYYVIAIGGPERLEYFSLKKDPNAD
jgi:hypothetical protein